ncbi:MAG: Rrf2 family transcriptional regulator [Coriobacteriales bacterium]|jgi:Rrf2 family protein|nr:Rrf2 family transcriptional regulator [Coriobacteriales bacterium]
MDISRRTDYAIRLIAALVEHDGMPLSVREAAEIQDVPYAFARSISHDLVLSGFVRSQRGAHGGMVLIKDPDTLTLLELIESVQGEIHTAICTTSPGWCSRDETCQFHATWEGANNLLRDYFSSVTIKQLLNGGRAHLTSRSGCYIAEESRAQDGA